MENKINTIQEIESEFIKSWNLPLASTIEIAQWKYKTNLMISPKFLINKTVIVNNVEFIVKNVFINKFGKLNIILDNNEITTPTQCYLKIKNPINNIENIIQLHPGRKGKSLWEKGYYLDEKNFKKHYYKTEEYKNKYSDSLYKSYGEKVNAPIQIKEIKNKISKTIQERYSVNWFLNRGNHYEKIEKAMIDKYGVKNLFNDLEWQHSQNRKSPNGISNIEKIFCSGITDFLLLKNNEFMCEHSSIGKKTFQIDNNYYIVDYYIPKVNMIIEFYGDYWHCNPIKYSRDYFHLYKGLTAEKIWEKDRIRLQKIVNKFNCNILTIWESEWKKNSIEQLNIIKTIYNEIIKNQKN